MRLSICAAFLVVLAFGVSAGYPSPTAGPRVGQRDANARKITDARTAAPRVGGPSSDYGTQTFAQLGIGDVHYAFPPPRFDRKPVFTLLFPAHAREGGNNWWILHLHMIVALSSEPKGEAAVGVSVNQVEAAGFRFEPRGKGAVAWDESGIVDGIQQHVTKQQSLDIHFSNYLAQISVHGGANQLMFHVGQWGGGVFRSVTFRADSSIEHTPLSPAEIRLSERLTPSRATPGQLVQAAATITNVGGGDARRVTVSVGVPKGVSVVGRKRIAVGTLASHQQRSVTIRVRPTLAGRFAIRIRAASTSNSASAVRTLRVSRL